MEIGLGSLSCKVQILAYLITTQERGEKMGRVKAKVTATASVELIVTLRKYGNGEFELDEVLEVLEVDDLDDIEIKSEF